MDFLDESLMNEWFSPSDNYKVNIDVEQLEQHLPYTQHTPSIVPSNNIPRLDHSHLPKSFHDSTRLPENFDSGLDEFLLFPLESDLFEPSAPSSDPALDGIECSLFPNMNKISPHSSQTTSDYQQTNFMNVSDMFTEFSIPNALPDTSLETVRSPNGFAPSFETNTVPEAMDAHNFWSKFPILNTPSKNCFDTVPSQGLDESFLPLAGPTHSHFHPLSFPSSELEATRFTGTMQAEKPDSSALPFVRFTELTEDFPVSTDQIQTVLSATEPNYNLIALNVGPNGMFRRTDNMELSRKVKTRYSFSLYPNS